MRILLPRTKEKRIRRIAFVAVLVVSSTFALAQTESKPKLTFDEFFNSVGYPALEISPDGNFVVIVAERADWDQQIFRDDLWLYRDDAKGSSLIQLTQSGHDSEPKWSPDGRWIAFLSGRKSSTEKSGDSDSDAAADQKDEPPAQIYLISPSGGEAFAVTQGEEEVHAFDWSADSGTIYFATRQPWTKTQKDDYKKDWKDVVQYRTSERGDTIFALNLATALAHHAAAPAKAESDSDKEDVTTPGAQPLATTPLRIDTLIASPDGRKLAFLTNAINQRQEKYEDVEIYTVDLSVGTAALGCPPGAARPCSGNARTLPATAGSHDNPSVEAKSVEPRRVTNNQATEIHPHWANDSRHIFFSVEGGAVSGPYRDLQPHLYWVDAESGAIEQWSQDFVGNVEHYAVAGDNVLTSARLGTEVEMYSVGKASDSLRAVGHWNGTYAAISAATRSPRIAFIYSLLEKPEEVYLADSARTLDQARPITSFNQLFTQRDLPQGKPYLWKADDGTSIEGMLIYPPGKFEAKHLPMFTFIHGGPNDADGNHFEADWYQWAALAATNGWLVFEPNYRGSTGYGDKFLMQIVPQMVSRPGKDILEGVDALVKDGIADPGHLTIGGYSYGGYMTNWLITQTTRFKAAVTGAGAVEHLANWGNDDTTYDDAYFLGGRPWEAAQRYHDEAAIFQVDKVRTPTHIVAGADDVRVATLEQYLLEHALYSLGIPNKLLIFPGEGHSLAKNPWHGKIKVREELKWLQKYGGVPAGN
ncbi:MAG TPA: prolyl oligopeptidase family serine peptidase [Candidatus Sulfotelmatobacter sp.]|nr:prolyl oligopeptidase family serine peptidase [Candidatus Sulfotelmatobacter sp.]